MTQISPKRASDWRNLLLRTLTQAYPKLAIRDAIRNDSKSVGVHLAVFTEPYLTYVLEGKKTIESRFGITRQPPFERVGEGDILVLKRSSGPVCGVCEVSRVWFYRLNSKTWPEIEKFSEALCMDGSDFWKKRRAAAYATLMQIRNVHILEEFAIPKADPRSWVVIKSNAPPDQWSLRWPDR